MGLIANHNARIGPARIFVDKQTGEIHLRYSGRYCLPGTDINGIAHQFGLERISGKHYLMTEEDWYILRNYNATKKDASGIPASAVTESTFTEYFAVTWPLEDDQYRSFNLGANWQSKKVVRDFLHYLKHHTNWSGWDALFLDGINNLDVADPVNYDFGGMGFYPTAWEGKLAFMSSIGAYIRNPDSTGHQKPLLLLGNIWDPKGSGGLEIARAYADSILRMDHYYYEKGGIGEQHANGVVPGTTLPAYVDPEDPTGAYIPASRLALDDAYGFNKNMDLYDRRVHYQQHLDACGTAGLHGAHFGWYGEDGVTRRDGNGELIYTNDLQLLRAIPNWDNLHEIPVPAFSDPSPDDLRSWENQIYRSTHSHACDSVVWSFSPFNRELYVVFRKKGAAIPLSGKVVRSAYWTDDWMRKSYRSARPDLEVTNGMIRLVDDSAEEGLMRGIRITFVDSVEADLSRYRDPFEWPFADTSIWNMPVGSGARFVDAGIASRTAEDFAVHHSVVILTPGEESMSVHSFPGGWNDDRCRKGEILGQFPIPEDFLVPYTGENTADPVAVMEPDHRTLAQGRPFHRCAGNDYATSKYWSTTEVDLYGSGIQGAHAGSGLSAIGGTIRLGEFTKGIIPHALKIVMSGATYYHYDSVSDTTPGYRWPAVQADADAQVKYGGANPAFCPGALLALRPDFDTALCTTVPGRILARALMKYGGYIVDDARRDAFGLSLEWSPGGRVEEEFRQLYGFDMEQQSAGHPWTKDLEAILTRLFIIDNNSPDSIGGGGIPLTDPAPEFLPTRLLSAETDGTPGVRMNLPNCIAIPMQKTTRLSVPEIPEGYAFSHWAVRSGFARLSDPDSSSTDVVLDWEDATLQAIFNRIICTLSTAVTGQGSLAVFPDRTQYEWGSEVRLGAFPDEGWKFKEWTGDYTGIDNPVYLTLIENLSITAVFESITATCDQPFAENPEYGSGVRMEIDPVSPAVRFFFTREPSRSVITIFDLRGRKIKQVNTAGSNRVNVTLEGMKSGLYIVKVRTKGSETSFHRIILNR